MLELLGTLIFFASIVFTTTFYSWVFGALGWTSEIAGWLAFALGAATVFLIIGGINRWNEVSKGRKKRGGANDNCGTSLAALAGEKTIMIKPTDTTSYGNNPVDSPTPDAAPKDTDILETTQPGVDLVIDSASSAADAGLIDPTLEDAESLTLDGEMDEAAPPMEVPMSDLEYSEPQLTSPVMGSMNAPGEVDMEELDEETVREALPPDARLDKLEE